MHSKLLKYLWSPLTWFNLKKNNAAIKENDFANKLLIWQLLWVSLLASLFSGEFSLEMNS